MSSGLSMIGSYDKVDEAQETASWRNRSRKRFVIISISSFLLLVIIVAAVVGTTANHGKDSGSAPSGPPNSIKLACAGARDPPQCEESLAVNGGNNNSDPTTLFVLSLKIALAEFSLVKDFPAKLANATNDTMVQAALNDCQLLINDSIEQLNTTLETTSTNPSQTGANQTIVDDLRIWLTAALTNIDTCFDGLQNTSGGVQAVLQAALQNSTLFTSNSLAIVTQLSDILARLGIPHRRLLSLPETVNDFPAWVSGNDRKLLQTSPGSGFRPDVTVAKDGSGDVKTIADALKKVPTGGSKRFVIYVKQGVYQEYVTVEKKKLVMLVGDGMYKTIVTGSRSVSAYTTFTSATFTVFGNGFMAKDIGFKNTAGAAKQQAVALMSKSDNSVFYRCYFDAFQDTLYVHTGRQFYRECTITGTVDFIFGNAAAVFQSCAILPREPMAGQFDTMTAQAKSDKNMPTGISFHMCQISGSVKAKVYFGRPWKAYSTVVVMKTNVGSLLTPAGWSPWTGNTAPSTIYYAEYANTGPGASTKGRVNWKGYHPSITDTEASKFTVGSFIGGNGWLPATGVPFQAGL